MFLTKPYKILPFSKWQNWPKSYKNSTSRMFDANNISARGYVPHIRLQFLQVRSKITLTPFRCQIHSKTEISYAIIQEYSQAYFQLEIGRKIRIFSLGRKNNILIIRVWFKQLFRSVKSKQRIRLYNLKQILNSLEDN